MGPTNAISMCLIVTIFLVSTIFLSSFASQAPVSEDSKLANADDFSASGLYARDALGYNVSYTEVGGDEISALKSIGMFLLRVDYKPNGCIPTHMHPESSELVNVLKGTIYVGFLIPDSVDRRKSQLVSKILNPGDVFVIPQGRIHFLYNVGHNVTATTFQYFDNLDYFIPTLIPNLLFASDPPIDDDFLAKSFQLDKRAIEHLQKKFS